jgi:hypothetical protein
MAQFLPTLPWGVVRFLRVLRSAKGPKKWREGGGKVLLPPGCTGTADMSAHTGRIIVED